MNTRQLLTDFSEVFTVDRAQAIKGIKIEFKLKENAILVFRRPFNVTYPLHEAIEQELREVEDAGIFQPTMYSKWASPVVIVPKHNGKIRLCGHYKVTLNPYLQVDKYLLLIIEDVVSGVSMGKFFSV